MYQSKRIEICNTDYSDKNKYPYSTQDKELLPYEMVSDITEIIRILLKNRYQMKIGFDGLTVTIEYDFRDEGMAGTSLEWLGEDEYIEELKNNLEAEEDANQNQSR